MKSATYERIYGMVRRIPRGSVSTYGRIAKATRCSGPRQVGYALHALDGSSAVPWHRVVNARGGISLSSAAAITQRLRLQAEGVEFGAAGRIDLARFGWMPAGYRRAGG